MIGKVTGKVKYVISHAPVYLQNIMEQRSNLKVQVFGHFSNIILLVALALGLYTRWKYSEDMAVLLFAFFGLFVFSIATMLVYYFSMETVGYCLARLWVGCLLGVIAFNEKLEYTFETSEQVMNILLVSSLVIRGFWGILDRYLHSAVANTRTGLVSNYESLEILGVAIASISTSNDYVDISLMLLAVLFTIIAIRLHSYFGLLNLLVIIIMCGAVFFPKILDLRANPYALICFISRLALEPVIDIYFSGMTVLERWKPIMNKRPILRRLMLLGMVALEITFFAVSAKRIPNHKEWFIVVPIFIAFGVVWFCYHIVLVITCWQLSNKMTECSATYNSMSEEHRNLHTIMASKGVRHFSLISQRLILVTFVTTVILCAIGWTTKTGASLSLWLMVMPIEMCVYNFLGELSSKLGGTCIGYAVVAPALKTRSDSPVTVLPTSAMHELSSKATHVLNSIQRFFSFHLIDTYGCDYSSSGLSAESVETKLKAFFQRITVDGPTYDTYFLFYSGHVCRNGDWALAGEETLKLTTIIEWWRECNMGSGARLILALDSRYSHMWVRNVKRLSEDFVAIQTYILVQSKDLECGTPAEMGDFTAEWVAYNCNQKSNVDWKHKERMIKAVYGTSRAWSDFTFHLPTEEDIAKHWDSNFPKVTKPLIKITNFPKIGSLFCCCTCLVQCLKRKKMMWLPPHELDTGHGFKLVRS